MQLTIIAGEHISSIEVADDIELENFLALCKLELPTIADIASDKLLLSYDGRQLQPNTTALLQTQIKELNMKNGDAIHIDIAAAVASSSASSAIAHHPHLSGQQAAAAGSSTARSKHGSTGGGGGGVSSLISNLVQSIKVPRLTAASGRQSAAEDGERERAMAENIFGALAEPHRLDFLKAEHPELAAAYEANPNDKEAFVLAFRQFKEEMARRARVMQDENSEEGQRYIAEMIERQNIEFMHQFAMEHMPEAYIPVHMLYIRMRINGHPVIAFVDSGAQTSILSESCARRCNVLRFMDRRFRTQAVGIGGSQKMLGRIHQVQVQVNQNIFPCPFEVMSDRDIDILFGLNTLLRHKCCLDFQRMVLRFGDGTETPFLSESEFQREKEAVRQDEVTAKPDEQQQQQ